RVFYNSFSLHRSNLKLTKQQINQIRDENLRLLLNGKKLQLPKEKERTKSFDDVYEILGGQYVVKLRPEIHEFLQEVNSTFDVSIYALGGRECANAVHNLLESEVGFPKGSCVISREDCVEDLQKRLDVILSHEKVVVIMDDTEDVWGDTCKNNLVKIDRCKFFAVKKDKDVGVVDVELNRVMKVLKGVHARFFEENEGHINVREVLKSILDVEGLRRKKLVTKLGDKRLRSANDTMDIDIVPAGCSQNTWT
ncbi:RNA polymerase II C-terminal domain phosphatase-like 4, partial [Bienertia sinuspersici]